MTWEERMEHGPWYEKITQNHGEVWEDGSEGSWL